MNPGAAGGPDGRAGAPVGEATPDGRVTPERWRAVTRVVQDALERAPAERAAFVAAACAGDPTLRREVESLLAGADENESLPGARAAVRAAAASFPARPTFPLPTLGSADATVDESARLERLTAALAERYAIEGVLGRGGTSTVYRARDLRNRRPVAIKVLHAEVAAEVGPRRFVREIETAANLSHPHVLPLFDSGEADGLRYYVMPYVTGGTLRDRLASGAPIPTETARRVMRDVADALDHAHRRGVVHRDVKPENILLTDGDHVLVADFGVARVGHPDGASDGDALTGPGMVLGTPGYMSPEQAMGRDDVDHRADLYAWGVVAYEVLAGRHPFPGRATAWQLITAHASSAPTPLGNVALTVPQPLAALVMRALAKDPARRPATAAEVVRALDALDQPAGAAAPTGVLGRLAALFARWRGDGPGRAR